MSRLLNAVSVLVCGSMVAACGPSMRFVSRSARSIDGVTVNRSVDDATARALLDVARACSDLSCIDPAVAANIPYMKGYTRIVGITVLRAPTTQATTFVITIHPQDHLVLELYVQGTLSKSDPFRVVEAHYGEAG